jgi:hypothetical protein
MRTLLDEGDLPIADTQRKQVAVIAPVEESLPQMIRMLGLSVFAIRPPVCEPSLELRIEAKSGSNQPNTVGSAGSLR